MAATERTTRIPVAVLIPGLNNQRSLSGLAPATDRWQAAHASV